MPTPYELDLTASQVNEALNAAYDTGDPVTSGSVKLVRSDAVYNAIVNRAEVVSVPASAGATGTAGQVAYASGWFYVCVATNTWQRVALATW